MCHHFIGFQTYDRLPKHRAIWRCSACGRESWTPIDCCAQPAFATIPRSGIGHAFRQWLQTIANRAVAGLAAVRPRHRFSESEIGVTNVTAAYIDSEVDDPVLVETDTESAELEETTYASV